MAEIINLDALIQREDFEIQDSSGQSQLSQTIQIRDPEPKFFSDIKLDRDGLPRFLSARIKSTPLCFV